MNFQFEILAAKMNEAMETATKQRAIYACMTIYVLDDDHFQKLQAFAKERDWEVIEDDFGITLRKKVPDPNKDSRKTSSIILTDEERIFCPR